MENKKRNRGGQKEGVRMDVHCSVFIATSLDGFIARLNGDIDWLTGGEQSESGEDYGYKAYFDSIDMLVMGRNTYEKVASFSEWPYGDKPVVVLSSRALPVPERLGGKVETMSGAPGEVVGRLAGRGARRLYIDGGVTIQGFLRAGLIDEMTITRLPALIGEGLPLFGRLDGDIRLEHLGTKSYANGLVQSRYRVIIGPTPDPSLS